MFGRSDAMGWSMADRAQLVLSDATDGSRVRIESLPQHAALRSRLVAMGIRPGVELEVHRRGQPGGILHLGHGVMEFMLRREHAAQIAITLLGP